MAIFGGRSGVRLRGRLLAVLGLLALVAGGCRAGAGVAKSTAGWPEGTGFVRVDIDVDGVRSPLWVFVPRDYDPARPTPAILFLHGLFEAGGGSVADGRALTAGLGPAIARSPEAWPFLTVFPQSDGTWRGPQRERLALAALDAAAARWSIDADRVVLAGLSYGALGTWQIGARHAERFAALVPVSGHRASEPVERLAMLPVWAFHYAGDLVVPSAGSEAMCMAIVRAGGNAKLTEFPGVGHDAWDRALAESELVAWMLTQRRSPHPAELPAEADKTPLAAAANAE